MTLGVACSGEDPAPADGQGQGGAVSTAGGAAGFPVAGGAANGGSAGSGGTSAGATSSGGTAAGGAPVSTGGASLGGAAGGVPAGGNANAGGLGVSGAGRGGASTGGGSSGGAGKGGGAAMGGAAGSGGAATGGAAGSGGAATGGAPSMGGSTAAGTGAPQTAPTGYGRATTGGGNAQKVAVATMEAMQAAIDAYGGSGGLVLEYTGTFNFKSITDVCVQHTLEAKTLEVKNKNDITILGKDGSAANFGIHIAGSASNIIIRNMTIGLTPGADASDMISIEGMSSGAPKNIWIDHNELFSSMTSCPGAGDTSFDGMLDVKKGADNITVSYNYMHDHQKVSLNGFSDSDDLARHITFHHNIFENIGSRVPLQRHGYSHLLNNYFLTVTVSGINVRMGGYALVEANYFEKVHNPVTSRDSPAVGFWDLRNNNLATAADVAAGNRFGITWGPGDTGTVNATSWTTTAAYPKALGYPYTADPSQCIRDGLRAAAGAGKGLVTLKCK